MGAAGDRSAGNGAEGDGGWLKGAQTGGGPMGDGVNGWRMEEVHRGYGLCSNSAVQKRLHLFSKGSASSTRRVRNNGTLALQTVMPVKQLRHRLHSTSHGIFHKHGLLDTFTSALQCAKLSAKSKARLLNHSGT